MSSKPLIRPSLLSISAHLVEAGRPHLVDDQPHARDDEDDPRQAARACCLVMVKGRGMQRRIPTIALALALSLALALALTLATEHRGVERDHVHLDLVRVGVEGLVELGLGLRS